MAAASVDEQESLLKSYYADEKDPDTKEEVANGDGAEKNQNDDSSAVSSHGFPPAIAIGTPPPPPPPRSAWSTSLFACFGSNDEFFTSDVEVCKFLDLYIFFFFFLIDDLVFVILGFLSKSICKKRPRNDVLERGR